MGITTCGRKRTGYFMTLKSTLSAPSHHPSKSSTTTKFGATFIYYFLNQFLILWILQNKFIVYFPPILIAFRILILTLIATDLFRS